MAIAVAVVATVVFSAGQDLHPRRRSRAATTWRTGHLPRGQVRPQAVGRVREHRERRRLARGKPRVDNGRLTGDVSCVEGGSEPSSTRTAASGRSTGTIGGRPLQAALTRDPPPPGPRPRAPDSIAGDYVIKPRSACLGAKMAIEGSGPEYELVRERNDARAPSTTRRARSRARRNCADGSKEHRGQGGRPHDHADGRRGPGDRGEAARGGQPLRRLLHRRGGRDARRAAVRDAGRAARPAARDGRGARRHRARARRSSARSAGPRDGPLPERHHPVHRRGRPARADLLHVPDRPRGRPEPDQGPGRTGRRDLERERRAADDARHRRRAAGLRAGRAGQEVRRLRALHGRLDVDHGLPGARAHPGRAADAQAPGRRARARLRGRGRRDGLVPDRARHARSPWRARAREVVETIAPGGRLLPRDGLRGPAAPGARLDRLRRGRPRAGRLGRARSSRACCCPPTRPRRSASR